MKFKVPPKTGKSAQKRKVKPIKPKLKRRPSVIDIGDAPEVYENPYKKMRLEQTRQRRENLRAEGLLPPKKAMGRPRGDKMATLLQEMNESLKGGESQKLIDQVLRVAIGDVVGLGYLTQEEYDQEAEFDEDGNVLKKSGAEKALELIPPSLRAKMLIELVPFYLAKKKEADSSNTNKNSVRVNFFMPDNGRDHAAS